MGNSKFEKIYAVSVVLVLWVFLGSIMMYYFQRHNLGDGDFINLGIKINWAELYPFTEEDNTNKTSDDGSYVKYPQWIQKYLSIVDAIKLRIDLYTREKIFARGRLIVTASSIKRGLRWPDDKITIEDGVIEMNNGYLTWKVGTLITEKKLDEIADSIKDFKDFLTSKEIGFIYANAGYKVNPKNQQLNYFWRAHDFKNKNYDQLIKALQNRAIDVIDFREEILNSKLEWYDFYYVSDHHWKNSTQLWAAGLIAEKLNKDYGFHYDLSYFDRDSYSFTLYKKNFLGSQGRRKADFKYLEDYELILPKFETQFEIDIPKQNLHLSGEYKDTLLDMQLLKEIQMYTREDFLEKTDIYSLARIPNGVEKASMFNVKKNNNEGRKILVLMDSFGMYVAEYLAMDISQIDIIYPLHFSGSIRTYIKKTKPDMVILVCTGIFSI